MEDTLISFYYPHQIETCPCPYLQKENACTLSGQLSAVVNCRAMLLRAQHTQVIKIIQAPILREEHIQKIRLIAQEFGSKVVVEMSEVRCMGGWDAVHSTITRVCLLMDELAGWACAKYEVDVRYAMIVGGIDQNDIKQIMKDTSTQIYIPNPFKLKQSDPYFMSGDPDSVNDAIQRITQLILMKQQGIVSKNGTCLPKKLDWMMRCKKEEMYEIMCTNGVFIHLPLLGSNSNLVSFLGTDETSIDRTMRQFYLLTTSFYVSCIQLKNKIILSMETLCHITSNSKAEIVIQKNFIEIYGLETQVRSAYVLLCALPQIKGSIKDTKFQIECALEHKDFIQGKKNGKISKITKMTDAKITLHDMANNMLIDVYHPIPEKELLAITLLQDELPSEISFCVPEAYHKKIIGVGGKNIQKFMKKHGVYVKFANQAEHQKIGGYYALKDNVIARTPAKNESALYDLKNDIIELIEDKDNEEMHVSQLIPVARELIPMVFGTDAATIEEIQIQTKTKIMIPLSNLAQEGIIVVGLSKNIQSVLSSILKLVPTRQSISMLTTPELLKILTSTAFQSHVSFLSNEVTTRLTLTYPTPTETLLTFTTTSSLSLQLSIQKTMTLLSPKQNPFASKLFSSFPSNLVTDSRSVPDLRYVFDAPLPSSRKTRLPTRELFEESPNRDTLSFLSTSLSGARLDDEWLESVESDAPLDVNQKQKVELKTPTGIFRGMSLSVSEPHLNDV